MLPGQVLYPAENFLFYDAPCPAWFLKIKTHHLLPCSQNTDFGSGLVFCQRKDSGFIHLGIRKQSRHFAATVIRTRNSGNIYMTA